MHPAEPRLESFWVDSHKLNSHLRYWHFCFCMNSRLTCNQKMHRTDYESPPKRSRTNKKLSSVMRKFVQEVRRRFLEAKLPMVFVQCQISAPAAPHWKQAMWILKHCDCLFQQKAKKIQKGQMQPDPQKIWVFDMVSLFQFQQASPSHLFFLRNTPQTMSGPTSGTLRRYWRHTLAGCSRRDWLTPTRFRPHRLHWRRCCWRWLCHWWWAFFEPHDLQRAIHLIKSSVAQVGSKNIFHRCCQDI